jgi:hypothetical protein
MQLLADQPRGFIPGQLKRPAPKEVLPGEYSLLHVGRDGRRQEFPVSGSEQPLLQESHIVRPAGRQAAIHEHEERQENRRLKAPSHGTALSSIRQCIFLAYPGAQKKQV